MSGDEGAEEVKEMVVDGDQDLQPDEPEEAVQEVMNVTTAIPRVLRQAYAVGGLARGLREAAKALDRGNAQLAILASDCDNEEYKRLVEALCVHHKVRLLKVADAKQLGEWANLCKYDKTGKPRKIVGCSCVVVYKWGKKEAAHKFLHDYLKNAEAETKAE